LYKKDKMNHLDNRFFTAFVVVLLGGIGVMLFDLEHSIQSTRSERLAREKQQEDARTIETTAFRCFNDKDYKEFILDTKRLYCETTLSNTYSVSLMKERWEKTGQWAKALQSQCHEDGTERR
jgi:hypothetical protein